MGLIDARDISRALGAVAWVRRVVMLDETPSTNTEALALADGGAPEGTVVVADRQTAGRGRLGRSWWSAPGASLIASWVVRPSWHLEQWPLIPLAAGVAAASAARRRGVDAALKWPNDVIVGDRKLGGILVEAKPPHTAVVGIGINIAGELPVDLAENATTMTLEGAFAPNRAELLAGIVEEFSRLLSDPGVIVERYRPLCATIGRVVRVELASGSVIEGLATGVDSGGALTVSMPSGDVAVTSGDAVHVRATAPKGA